MDLKHNHKCPYKKEAEGNFNAERKEEGSEDRCYAAGFRVGGSDRESMREMQLLEAEKAREQILVIASGGSMGW